MVRNAKESLSDLIAARSPPLHVVACRGELVALGSRRRVKVRTTRANCLPLLAATSIIYIWYDVERSGPHCFLGQLFSSCRRDTHTARAEPSQVATADAVAAAAAAADAA